MKTGLHYISKIIIFLRYYLDLLIDKFYGLYYERQRKYIPIIKNEIILEKVNTLVEKIRNRQLTSEEVVQAFINRIIEVNPILNAMIDNRFEEALQEARLLDRDIDTGTLSSDDLNEKPLLGIPFTTKETTACTGLSWTFGLKKRREKKALYDADCIKAMRKAGAILLGVTNVPQLNLWQEVSNPLFGQTKNPYNTTRNVGGSTGGEGSILAACGSPLGLGTDAGGSCRIPALMCGVFGHKLTNHLQSTKGLTYRSGEEKDTILSYGPLVRYVDDFVPFIRAIIGKNADQLKLDEPVLLKNLKIYYITDPKDYLMSPIRQEMSDALIKAVKHLAGICRNKPEKLHFSELKYQYKIWKYWMSVEKANYLSDLNNREGELNALWEIVKHFTVGGDFTTATIYQLISGFMKPVNKAWAIEKTEQLRQSLLEKLDENSVLIYPSAPFTARHHHTPLLRPFNFGCFAIWNAVKFVATQVPMGLDKEGLPLGIQVVAAPYQDRLCLAVAKELENAFGGYVLPNTSSL